MKPWREGTLYSALAEGDGGRLQGPLEGTLNEEEAHRNSTRIDLIYMSSFHPLAPDIFEIADAARSVAADKRIAMSRPIPARLSGTPS